MTAKEIQDLCNSSRERVKDLSAVVEDWIMGMAGREDTTEIMDSLKMLKDFSFSHGKYDALYGVMSDNNIKDIEGNE